MLLFLSNCMFSFSGIQSQIAREIEKNELPAASNEKTADLCASLEFQLGYILGRRLARAVEFAHLKSLWKPDRKPQIVVSGGVACNQRIRRILTFVADQNGCEIIFPPVKYCSDNGVMIAWNGVEKWNKRLDLVPWTQVFDIDAEPRCAFGTDITEDVLAANIKNQKINLNALL